MAKQLIYNFRKCYFMYKFSFYVWPCMCKVTDDSN